MDCYIDKFRYVCMFNGSGMRIAGSNAQPAHFKMRNYRYAQAKPYQVAPKISGMGKCLSGNARDAFIDAAPVGLFSEKGPDGGAG